MGEPGGIGPEVIVKALGDNARRDQARFRIHGVEQALLSAARLTGVAPFWSFSPPTSPGDVQLVACDVADPAIACLPQPSAAGGATSFACVQRAIDDVLTPEGEPARAIVTGPISKEAWALAGHSQYPGHTELLADRFSAARHAMLFHSPELRVALVTGHVPLRRVPEVLTTARVLDVIRLGAEALARFGQPAARVGVCGLNPHAGEAGLLGDEDARIIAPAIAQARREGIDARGPFPGDTIFRSAVRGELDLVVAMYHDQGLIPVKLLAFDHAVNVTVGLSVTRTSPDHGTAFAIAGRGIANAGSMRAAIELAIRAAQRS